jgi:hypothetical protein
VEPMRNVSPPPQAPAPYPPQFETPAGFSPTPPPAAPLQPPPQQVPGPHFTEVPVSQDELMTMMDQEFTPRQ